MKKQYKLNPDTLHYEPAKSKSGFSVKNVLWIFLSGLGFAFAIIILVAYLYPTPHERQLRHDLAVLEKNYDVLSKKLDESINIYESLLEKEKKLQKLTFDVEIEELNSITKEMSMFSPDFDFSGLLQTTETNIILSSRASQQLIWKIRLLLELAYSKKIFLQSVPSMIPLDKDQFVLVSGYGMRIHPIFKTLRLHKGVDIAARQGTPVYATGNGVVIRPPDDTEGLGNIVAIDHGFGYVTVYGCLLKSEVKPGARVERGQIIGSVGRSGIATGPQLHYEIRKNGKPLNPVNYFFLSFSPEELHELMEKASVQNQNMS